jgi:hypothetical protein
VYGSILKGIVTQVTKEAEYMRVDLEKYMERIKAYSKIDDNT